MEAHIVLSAYRAITALQRCEMVSFRDAYAVAKLKSEMKPFIDTMIEEEEKILRKHGGKREKGEWVFSTAEERQNCMIDISRLHDESTDVQFGKIKIHLPGGEIPVKPCDVEALLNFVEVEA